ncbi:hypothetical protein ES707_04265 [subsurface metagenome]
MVAGREIILVDRDLSVRCRGRNVVLDIDREAARQRDGIAVRVGELDRRRQVQRQGLAVVVGRRVRGVVELVEQRELVGAVRLHLQRENLAVAAVEAAAIATVDIGGQFVAADRIKNRFALRGDRGQPDRVRGQRVRAILVGADLDQRVQESRRDRSLAAFGIADRLAV